MANIGFAQDIAWSRAVAALCGMYIDISAQLQRVPEYAWLVYNPTGRCSRHQMCDHNEIETQ